MDLGYVYRYSLCARPKGASQAVPASVWLDSCCKLYHWYYQQHSSSRLELTGTGHEKNAPAPGNSTHYDSLILGVDLPCSAAHKRTYTLIYFIAQHNFSSVSPPTSPLPSYLHSRLPKL